MFSSNKYLEVFAHPAVDPPQRNLLFTVLSSPAIARTENAVHVHLLANIDVKLRVWYFYVNFYLKYLKYNCNVASLLTIDKTTIYRDTLLIYLSRLPPGLKVIR